MAKHTQEAETAIKGPCGLDELIRQGARQVIHQAIEAELAALREQSMIICLSAKASRPSVRCWSRHRRCSTVWARGAKSNSNMVPPYVRKSPRASAALPWLYLRGVSTGDMSEAFSVLLGATGQRALAERRGAAESAVGARSAVDARI